MVISWCAQDQPVLNWWTTLFNLEGTYGISSYQKQTSLTNLFVPAGNVRRWGLSLLRAQFRNLFYIGTHFIYIVYCNVTMYGFKERMCKSHLITWICFIFVFVFVFCLLMHVLLGFVCVFCLFSMCFCILCMYSRCLQRANWWSARSPHSVISVWTVTGRKSSRWRGWAQTAWKDPGKEASEVSLK